MILLIPLTLDDATIKRTFGHFARVLVNVNLNYDLCERGLVGANEFALYVCRI